jgi:hypothetical protein
LTVSVADDVLTLTVPDYYGNGGAMPSPGSTPSDPKVVNGLVSYSPTPVTITYYQQGASFYRTVNGVPTEIANNVADFAVTEAASGSFVTCSTTFSPSFTYNPSADAIAATSVFTSVYPRNASAQP